MLYNTILGTITSSVTVCNNNITFQHIRAYIAAREATLQAVPLVPGARVPRAAGPGSGGRLARRPPGGAVYGHYGTPDRWHSW